MVDFSSSLKDAAKGALCSYLDGFAAFLRLPSSQFGGAIPALTAEALRSALARRLCNREAPPLALPFPGGQCDTLYQVDVNATATRIGGPSAGTETADFTNTWRGPIANVRLYRPDPRGGTNDFYILGTSSNPDPAWNGFFNLGFFSELLFESVVINSITITRLDGLPDDCGNPLPDTPDYAREDYSFDTDIVYTNNDGVDITIPVGVAVGLAYIDADLNLNIPVDFTFSPNFNFDPTFKFDIPVTFNFNTGDFNIGPPKGVGEPPPTLPPPPDFDFDFDFDLPAPPPKPPDIPDPPPVDDDKPLQPVILGAMVTTTSIQSGSKVSIIGQSFNPDVHVPDLGLVSFEIRSRAGSTAWTEDIRVKSTRAFIPCPWGGGAVRVAGTPRPGVTFTVTPVYGQPDPRF